ncbi:MAG TPA: hypothetical protein VFI19_07815 [Nocardioides sp.]|jgi:hypothetical protein|nr:hypothetical protein [Nocardioides sp.]
MTSTPTRGDYDGGTRTAVAMTVNTFAGVMLLIVAVLEVLDGIAAAANDEIFVRGIKYAYKLDLTAWGWIHIVIGAIGIATAIGILMNQVWGQLAGVVIAGLGILAAFGFMPYYPFWGLVLIGFNVLVIWSLCTGISQNQEY